MWLVIFTGINFCKKKKPKFQVLIVQWQVTLQGMTLLNAIYKTRYDLAWRHFVFPVCIRTNVSNSVVAKFVTWSELACQIAQALQIIKMWNWKLSLWVTTPRCQARSYLVLHQAKPVYCFVSLAFSSATFLNWWTIRSVWEQLSSDPVILTPLSH